MHESKHFLPGQFVHSDINDRNLIFGYKLDIGMPYRGKRFLEPSDSYVLF
ncbi:hypothetical protein BROOK1789C_1202, partial [Bathymodiolus brooksi thiotrophic gill symbiont]